jgi:hypothetical protein
LLVDSSDQSKIEYSKSKMLALVGFIVAGVIVLGIVGWYFGLYVLEQ